MKIKKWSTFNESDNNIRDDIESEQITEDKLRINSIVEYIKNGDSDKLQKLLDDGIDPNFFNKLPLRVCCLGTWESKLNIGKSYFDIFKLFVDNGANTDGLLRWAAEFGRYEIIDYLAKIKPIDYDEIEKAINWLRHSRRQTENNKVEIIEYLQKLR